MSILSGYNKYKRYIKTDDGYKLCSQWTSSNTLHFDDDKTAQTKVGDIDGITDSLTATSSNIALSAAGGNNLQTQIDKVNSNLSHVGMIIHSTTLDTMDKVIAIYGGTKWVKIEGRMLLGANNTYAVNSTGGEASHILTTNELPSHNHIFTGNRALTEGGGEHVHSAECSQGVAGRNDWGLIAEGAFGGNVLLTNGNSPVLGTIRSAGSHQHFFTPSGSIGNSGGSKAHNNMPPYKVVYIWERTE